MKTVLALILSFAGIAVAQDHAVKTIAPDTTEPVQAKRVKSVTWDLQSQKLVWIVENGTAQNGKFTPSSEERYEISPSDQKMTFNGEQRGFSDDEGVWLNHLLTILTMYCAESVVWWVNGDEGSSPDRQTPNAQPQQQKPSDQSDDTPTKIKIAYPEVHRAPGAVPLIARNMAY
jgi:hypothetical protein